MPSITKQNMGKYTYLNESESFWDNDKKCPDNNKVRIGMIDNTTGKKYYKQEYIDRLKYQGESVDRMLVWKDLRKAKRITDPENMISSNEVAFEVLNNIKDFGVTYFLRHIADDIGLIQVLKKSLPHHWEELFMLACYLVAEDKPVMYCEDWVSDNECPDIGTMSSQKVSKLLAGFGYNERSRFYKEWYTLISEREYIALDITSISTYSNNIIEGEWGYNRDGEDLPQINICMLFGESSRLPVYQTIYSGSLKDVSTLKTTLEEFTAMTGTSDIMVVLDKGFYSKKNVDTMLSNGEEDDISYKFLISVPFTTKFAKDLVLSERKDIDNIDNVIFTSDKPIRGIHKLRAWPSKEEKIHAHVFFNPEKAVKEQNELYGHVAFLKALALKNPEDEKAANDFKKYLIIRKSEKTEEGVTVNIRNAVVSKELETAGWFVLISNHVEDTQEAHDVYRMKDVVEKSFYSYKNNLGIDRLRVHGDDRMQNKVFAAFIALILSSRINSVMSEKKLYDEMTFNKLLIILSKLKAATINGTRILRPMTKEQKLIFESFGIKLPEQVTD